MELLVILGCCLAFILIGNTFTPFQSPDPHLQDEEFTFLLNACICFIISCLLIITI